MMPANKILTVAYGTFSCTLEGFDDPFSAMTDIAEYFRDLAAEDRYFGAEPPQPDPAMLREIAENRAKRQIEAEPRKDGVTLRPSEATGSDVVEAQADVAFAGDEDPMDKLVEDAFDAQDEAQAFVAPSTTDADVADSVAEKLARIRGVVEADRASSPNADSGDTASDWSGYDDTESPLEAVEAAAETPAEEVISQADQDAVDGADTAEQEAEIEVVASDADEDELDLDAVSHAVADTDSAEEEAVAEEVQAPEQVEETAEDIAAAPEADADADADADETSADDDDSAEPARRVLRLRVRRRAQAELAAAAEAAEQLPAGTADAIKEAASAEESTDAPATDTSLDADDEAELMAELAAIAADGSDDDAEDAVAEDAVAAEIDDIEADLALQEDEEDAEALDADLDALLAAADADPISDEDEVDLDDLEDEIDLSEDDLSFEDDEIDLSDDADGQADGSESSPDLERLFAATDSRLEGAETSRVHANISHLKAAVAARRADSTMDTPQSDGTDAYRVDLANTVRPRRAEADEDAPRTERPAQRPAPLMLVSEQRVESDEETVSEDPVRPRRVTTRELLEAEAAEAKANAEIAQAAAAQDAAQQDEDAIDAEPSTDFEAFTMETGANDLPAILEAAAAYTTQVIGDENFSRPRLLHLAAEAGEDFSREEGLRAFGQLLRDGMILKVSRGTFTLSESSRFLAEAARRAG